MVLEINGIYMFLTSAKGVWKVVKLTYSKVKDVAQIYDIKVKIVAVKQGNKSKALFMLS